MAIELRVEDVKQRRDMKALLEQERQDAIAREEDRQDKRRIAYEEAKAAFEEKVELEWAMRKEQEEENEDEAPDDEDEKPEFDGEEWYAHFDDEFPPGEIPAEVQPDIDQDFNIVIEEAQGEE
jgi:hypothetical protein